MKRFLPLMALVLLGACETAPKDYIAPPLAFEQQQAAPLSFRIARVDVLNHYESPYRRPNVEQDFPVSPAQAIEKWVALRMRASGGTGRLEVTINDASAVETPLKKTKGIEGLFTDDQDTRYDAKLNVTFRLYTDESTVSRAVADVTVTRYVTINERATVVDRQKLYHRMLDQMMGDFNREAESQLARYFSAWRG